MTLFVGGPFDGADLPFDPRFVKHVKLPPREHFDDFCNDPDQTAENEWPHHYVADSMIDFPVYRFAGTSRRDAA